MSKTQSISGRSSFATVCDTARRMGYRLLVCANGKVWLIKGLTLAVVPCEDVAAYLQAKAAENAPSGEIEQPEAIEQPVNEDSHEQDGEQ